MTHAISFADLVNQPTPNVTIAVLLSQAERSLQEARRCKQWPDDMDTAAILHQHLSEVAILLQIAETAHGGAGKSRTVGKPATLDERIAFLRTYACGLPPKLSLRDAYYLNPRLQDAEDFLRVGDLQSAVPLVQSVEMIVTGRDQPIRSSHHPYDAPSLQADINALRRHIES